jgi:anti-sigma factor RsiW
MSHLSETTLALYAGGELPFVDRCRVAFHLRACERCRRQVESLREVRGWLHEQDNELPAGLRWEPLAAEMTANIRLGLAAGRCVPATETHANPPLRNRWRMPAMALPVLLLVVAGWILQSWHPPLKQPSPEFVLESGSSGIGFERDGRGFTLLNTGAENVVSSVRGEAAGARYVDASTGQVTISHVFAQ